jgi:hypothetical protein
MFKLYAINMFKPSVIMIHRRKHATTGENVSQGEQQELCGNISSVEVNVLFLKVMCIKRR